MVSKSQKILAELENIDNIFNEMPRYSVLPKLFVLELAGVAALLHNLYNGIENILKQIFVSEKKSIPDRRSWHKELLDKSVKEGILSQECKIQLGEYLAFRHFFSHAYSKNIDVFEAKSKKNTRRDVF